MKQSITFGSSFIAAIFAAHVATAQSGDQQEKATPGPVELYDGSRFYKLDLSETQVFDCGGYPGEMAMTAHGIGAICDDDNPDDERPLPPQGGASPSM